MNCKYLVKSVETFKMHLVKAGAPAQPEDAGNQFRVGKWEEPGVLKRGRTLRVWAKQLIPLEKTPSRWLAHPIRQWRSATGGVLL